MNIDDRPTNLPTDWQTDDWPTDDWPQVPFTHFANISNGHNSVMCQPIPIMFGSRWGLRGRRIEQRHFWFSWVKSNMAARGHFW